jgi:aryl-alcohol dehydrogenase-like predicted oxidoreductase
METRKIGSLDVTVVGIGGDNFGGRVDEQQSIEVLHAALAEGINFIDTADDYPVVPRGRWTMSEEIIGRALKGRRSEAVIATKFGLRPDVEELNGASRAIVAEAIEASLRRLQTDYVDLYIRHKPDPNVPIAETLGALAELVEAGKVREIGCSNFTVDQIREAKAAVAPGSASFVCVQNEYSLLVRRDELDVIPECESTGLSYLPFFPLYNGLLTGGYRKGAPWPDDSRFVGAADDRLARVFSERNVGIIESLAEYGESAGHTILEMAFARLLANPSLSSVIAGVTSVEQVRANAAAGSCKLDEADIAAVDRIAPILA